MLTTFIRRLTVPTILAVQVTGAYAQPSNIAVDVTSCLLRPKQVIELGSSVFGVISQLFVDRGDRVSKDQLVAKLNTTVEEAQLALDKFRASNTTTIEAVETDMAWNERELARRRQLVGNMFSKANDIDEIVTKIEQNKIAKRRGETDKRTAELEANRAEAQLALKLIKSPVDGVITDIKRMPGEYLHEQAIIMTIAQIDPLNVDLVVPAEYYGAVTLGLVTTLRLAAPVNKMMPATVDAIDPTIDAASDTFRIRLMLPNPGNAIPAGVRCSVRLPNREDG